MTNEEINIAIAESLGEINPRYTENGAFIASYALNQHGQPFGRHGLPNYAADLNACHDFVKTLSHELQPYYMQHLFYVLIKIKGADGVSDFDKHTAEAKYCAEAYLKTIGKWKE